MHKIDVLVTGYGLVAPGVLDARGLFALLGAQGSCIREHSGLIDDQQWQIIHEALADEVLPPTRQHALTRYVAGQALAQAGLTTQDFRSAISGLFIGCQQTRAPQSRDLAGWLGAHDYVSAHSDAGAASTIAIGNAYRAIASGEIDLALCGGFELLNSMAPDEASTDHAPRHVGAGDLALSEGAALVVLESASHAQRRGARALGKVLGFAGLCQPPTATATGSHYIQCIQAALDDARLGAHQVEHVNLHAPFDPDEALAIRQVFGTALHNMMFTANKPATGNVLAGGGAIEAVLSLMSLQLGVLLPTLDYSPGQGGLPAINFPDSLMQYPVNAVLSNSFGRDGANGSLVLGRA